MSWATKWSKACSWLMALLLFASIGSSLWVGQANAVPGGTFNPGRIIDDAVFFDGQAMNVTSIQNFMNAQVPTCDTNGTQFTTHWYAAKSRYYTRAEWSRMQGYPPPFICLKSYRQTIPAKSTDAFCSGSVSSGTKSSAQIIYDVARACSVSPKVLLVLLQKEQGLVTDDWPWPNQYRAATGYGCPDTASCDPSFAGFFNQVYYAARQFQRYAVQSNLFNFQSGATERIYYNPNTACGSSLVTIQNQATAGLYNYTPYQPNRAALNNLYGTGDSCSAYGNRNFWRMFWDWFGNPNSPCYATTNVASTPSGRQLLSVHYSTRGADRLMYRRLNNTGSACVEVHLWNPGYISWYRHTVTNQMAVNPASKTIISGDINGDGRDELMYVNYNYGGKVKVYTWAPGYQKWASTTGTNLNALDPTKGQILAGDMNGDGRDELMYVNYNYGGKVKVYTWAPGYQKWAATSGTNLATLNPNRGQIMTADTNRDGKDELIYVNFDYGGRVKIYSWAHGYQSWASKITTNLAALDPNKGQILAGDANGDGRDELKYINYDYGGKVKVYNWASNYQKWTSTNGTNLSAIDPAN